MLIPQDFPSFESSSTRTLSPINFHLAENNSPSDLLQFLRNKFTSKKIETRQSTFHRWDTFDWRLNKNNLLLFQSKNKLCLLSKEATPPYPSPPPMFLKSCLKGATNKHLIKDPNLQNLIASHLSNRSLLDQVQYNQQSSLHSIFNKDMKTVAFMLYHRIYCESKYTEEKPSLSWVQLFPFRGYTEALNKIKIYFSPLLKSELKNPFDWAQLFLPISLRKNLNYNNRLRLHLDSNLDADQALIKIFNQCTKTIHLNTEGIVADLDVEFLHDYRVATRRVRSGISFAKKLFDRDALESAKTDMRMLGNATNKLRDIDVYLQREIKIKKSLPPEMSDALNPFFCELRKERILEQRKLKNFLKSNVYYEIIDRWELFLKENEFPDNPITNKISEKVGSIANKQILKALSKLMTEGYKINRDSPDEMLHELRIHGKKLRYLMEFYSSLYSENQVESFINNLKTLQKCLGKFNDRSMQQLKLNEYIKKLCIDKESIPLATAMGILIGNLQMDKVTLKCEFFTHFENFCSKNNLLNAKALFDYQPNS